MINLFIIIKNLENELLILKEKIYKLQSYIIRK